MNPQFHQLLTSAVQILKNSSFQFLCFFGLLFVSGLILTLISRWTNNTFQQFKFPRFGLYMFGAIGIPVHELCHAVFAKIFFHDIKSIKWFDPKGKGGSYGTVVHYYNDKNLYHRIGLFFIGLGPVILAPLILYAIYLFLVPGAHHFQFSLAKPSQSFMHLWTTFFHAQNLKSIGFYVFLYLTACLTSQMELSPEDFGVAKKGVFPFFALFVLVNFISAFLGFNFNTQFFRYFESALTIWAGFFALAILISLLNFLFFALTLSLFNRLMGRDFINPFRQT